VNDKLFAENKITMVNIWGTFCPPCIREMPDLGKLANANKANDVEIIGIPIDIVDGSGKLLTQENRDAKLIIKKTGADYVHVVPTVEMLYGFLRNVQAVPTTIFVDSNGQQIDEVYLGARSRKDWQKIIDDLLAAQ
jgi:thiol-disulfide isomerase/thioredoxin